MSLRHLFFVSYWFSQPDSFSGRLLTGGLVCFLAFIILGVVLLVGRRRLALVPEQRLWGRWSALLITLGLIGLLWLSLRQERVTFLAWRFWMLLWIVALVWWGGRLLWYRFRRLPLIKEEHAARARKEKYLAR